MRLVSLLIISILLSVSDVTLAEPVSVTDDAGYQIQLDRPATRVITLSAHTTELLYAAGAGDSLLATVRHSNYPPQVSKLPRIGDSGRIDIEKILSYQPDLVIAWLAGSTPQHQVEKLQSFGVKVFYSRPKVPEDVASNIRRIGVLTGRGQQADAFSQQFLARLEGLRQAYQQRKALSVFYQVWYQPIRTINRQQMISSLIELCGGSNIFAELSMVAPTVSKEEVVKRNPDVMFTAEDEFGSDRSLAHWRDWKEITAVRYDNLFTLPADWIHRQGPRILDAAEQMCRDMDTARQRLASGKKKRPGGNGEMQLEVQR